MGVKKYLGHFLLVVTIGFFGKQAFAQAMGGASASLVTKSYSITAVSVNSAGQTGDNGSFSPRISGDGRYVVFSSYANNLVDGDTNGRKDIFIYDRDDKSGNGIERISVDKDDTSKGGNGDSYDSAISADGRYVVFASSASNLVDNDNNKRGDIFIYDRDADGVNRIERISVDKDDTSKGGNWDLYDPTISADGRYVVFVSDASNLVDNDENDKSDIFIYDRDDTTTANRIQRISVDKDDTSKGGDGHSYWSAISANGRYVVFISEASNLIDGDNNIRRDLFIYDRDADGVNRIQRISVDKDDTSKGANANSDWPAISADGRYVVFSSFASNLVDGDGEEILIYDRDATSANRMQRLSVDKDDTSKGDNEYFIGPAAISGNGRYLVFSSYSSNLFNGGNNQGRDIFIYDRDAYGVNRIERISVDKDDTSKEGNGDSYNPAISANGRYVVFSSFASNLVDNDENDKSDIFIYDRDATNANGTGRISVDKDDINKGGR